MKLVNNNIEEIKQMINSSDKESRYLGISILRFDKSGIFSKKESKKLIKSILITERIRNFGDICIELEITEESCLIFKNPKTKEEKCFNALNKIFKIAECYNREKLIKGFPDFENHQQYKYFPCYDKKFGSWLVAGCDLWAAGSSLPGLAYFNSEENCKDAMNKFTDIFSDYLM